MFNSYILNMIQQGTMYLSLNLNDSSQKQCNIIILDQICFHFAKGGDIIIKTYSYVFV